jgi:hypothetical protein
MKRQLKVLVLLLSFVVVLSVGSVKAEPKTRTVEFTIGSGIPVIDGEPDVPLELPVFIEKGRTMIPVRFPSEAFNINTSWDNEKKIVTFKTKDVLIEMPENSKTVKVNGKEVQIDVPFFRYIPAQRMVVPIRFLLESFGATVSWDPDLHKATIVYELPEE